ncbi:MAG TPA: hypothetical protein VIY53_13000 [Acidobacteriaceae bacterium]
MKLRPALWLTLALAGSLTMAGCGKNSKQPPGSEGSPATNGAQAAAQNSAQLPPPAPAPAPVVIPANTRIQVRLDEPLGSKISVPGQAFRATVADDVLVNGLDLIPRGSHAEGTVIDAKPLGHFKGRALLELRLERVKTDSGSFAVATSTMERTERGKGRRTAKFAGGGGAFGAILGGIAGGGKGALIGGLVGAGAGTAGGAMTGNREIVLPAETLITFRLEKPVQVSQ